MNRTGGSITSSGRLWDGTPVPERPFAVIEAIQGQAKIQLTLNNEGGDVITRTCHVGGGWTCVVAAGGWKGFSIVAQKISDGATVSISWVQFYPLREAVYYYSESVTATTGTVPAGAFRVTLETADPSWDWINSSTVDGAGTAVVSLLAGSTNDVAGMQYTPSVSNRLVWHLRGL